MSAKPHASGVVSEMPVHNGDGYSWGGDVIVSFGAIAINLGTDNSYAKRKYILSLAHLIASAPDLLAAAKVLADRYPLDPELTELQIAIAKTEGGS